MALREIEFFNSPNREIMIQESGLPVRDLTILDRRIIEEMIIVIGDVFSEAYKILSELYAPSRLNKPLFEFKIVHRFIRCNFGEYDMFHCDIDICGNFRFEEVKCPLRGECTYEKKICKPKLNTSLTNRELQIIELIGIGWQTKEIADTLIISVSTVNRHRENIKAKLKLRTIGEVVNYYNTYLKHR